MHKGQTIQISQNTNKKHLMLNALFGVWVFCFGLFPGFAQAQILPACNPVPRSGGTAVPLLPTCDVGHLLELLVNIYNFLLGLAALVAMLFIVFGAVRMIYFSYWEDSAAELAAAKLTVSRAISGFIVIALSYLIVNTTLTMLGLASNTKIGALLIKYGLFRK